MSSTSSTTPQVQVPSTGIAPPSSSSSSSHKTGSPYSVGAIPAFKKAGINYAAAASSKSKPSPPAINGSVDVTATIASSGSSSASLAPVAASASQPANVASAPVNAHSRKESVKVEGVNVPPSRVSAIRDAASSSVAFGNVHDKNAILSSSPAAPPAVNGNGKHAFGTVGVVATPPLNLHSFFGGPSPSLPAATLPAGQQALAASVGRPSFGSPQQVPSSLPPNPTGLAHPPSQLSSTSQSFAPRGQPQPFVPQQQQGGFSPQPQYAYPPPGSSPYQQHAKPPAQNIPNGVPYGGPGGQQSGGANGGQGGPQRNGSYSSPVMQHRGQGGQQPGTPNRGQFGGPTSPRLSNALPPTNLMYNPGWAPPPPQGYPGYPQQGFYPPPMQGYALPPGGYAPPGSLSAAPPPSLGPSGSSTPSGVRTPSISSGGVPPSPSPLPLNLATASFTPGQPYSPQPQSATLPQHPHQFVPQHAAHASLGGAPALRAPGSPFALSAVAHAPEFKPSADAAPYTPRKSAAIKIRNPKDAGVVVPPKKGATPTPSEEDVKKTKDEADAATLAAKKVEDDATAATKKSEDDAKAEEERIAKEKADAEALAEKTLVEEEEKVAADAAVAEKERLEKEAQAKVEAEALAAKEKANEEAALAAKKVEEETASAALAAKAVEDLKVVEASAPTTLGEEVAGVQVSGSTVAAVLAEEVVLLADEKVVVEFKDPETALAEASETISPLPSKPVNGAAAATDAKPKHVPGPLDLSSTKAANVPAPLPSALLSARSIDNLASVTYPAGINSPRPDLNAEAEPGKYRYDREFLMQFMSVCIEKPEQLPNLEAIGMVDAGADQNQGRPNFPGNARRTSMGPPAVPTRGGHTPGPSAGGFGRPGPAGSGFAMGNFATAPGSTSLDRFNQSNIRNASGGGGQFQGPPGGGRAGSMSRTPSQGGVGGGNFQPAGRTPSSRGRVRGEAGGGGGGGRGGGGGQGGKHTTGDGFEGATIDVHAEDRWMPSVLTGGTAAAGADGAAVDSPEIVQRKVKALLNKLTLEKFDSISDQILAWADKSINEPDGRILRQVIALIFEKATDEANFSQMYARLCRKLMEKVSPNVKDESVKTPDGNFVTGGGLFRKYLLNRCQEDYENGWKAKELSAAAAASKAADDNAKKEANDVAEKEAKEGTAGSSSSAPKEAELLSDEYYAAQKAKRRGLGLVRFIGELYGLQMLTERIMHECIKKLLANTSDPEEEDVESLCRLLTTVGQGLDNAKAKAHMDIYFSRMKLIADNQKISSRIRFMIQDVLDLRMDRWRPRNIASGPKLLSEIHSDAAKASEESARRTVSSGGKGMPRLQDQNHQMSRPNSRRGQGRDQFGVPAVGPDGWSVPTPQRPAKAGDLSGFGKIREASSQINPSLGPSGAFANRAAKAKEAARPAQTPSNMFHLLESGTEASSSSSGRPKLVLAPRTKPVEGEEGAEGEEKAEEEHVEEEDEDDGAIDPNAVSMSRAEGERRAGNSVKEFFSVKNIAEGIASVEALPAEYRSLLVTALASAAIEKKADDVNLARQLFAEIAAKKVVSHAHMIQALTAPIKTLVDVAVDAPGAYNFMAQLLLGAGLSRAEVQELSTKMESEEEEPEDVENARGVLLAALDKLLG